MNITHISDEEITVPDTPLEILKGIFGRQAYLHGKYKYIELENELGLGLVKGIPFSIDHPKWQYIIKDFAWRVTEELAEAREAYHKGNDIHYVEELIDALHFYTELLIICGIKHTDIHKVFEVAATGKSAFWSVVYHLGIACNFLKLKPWKNTHVITDSQRFLDRLKMGYIELMTVILNAAIDGMPLSTPQNVYMLYYKKSLVNQFRQDTNY